MHFLFALDLEFGGRPRLRAVDFAEVEAGAEFVAMTAVRRTANQDDDVARILENGTA